MHVLVLPSWYPTGSDDIAGSFFREQAIAVQQAGAKVGVIALSLRSLRRRGAGPLPFREDDEGVATYRGSLLNFTPRIYQLIQLRTVGILRDLYRAYVAREGRPDIVHVHCAVPAGAGALHLRDRHDIPFVLSEHSSALVGDRLGRSGVVLAKRVAQGAAARFAVSTVFAKTLEQRLGLAQGGFSVMPNMVDDRFLGADLPDRAGEFRFLHVSLLDANKNVETLVRAFGERFKGRAEVSLVIGGDGPSCRQLQSLSRELGLEKQISFRGMLSRDQVRAALAESDAFVLSSRIETFGVVLIEALAMGVPVIATRCGGPEDIVTETSGSLVPVGDVPALGAAMEDMIDNRSRWNRHSLREDCRARFGAEAVTLRWLEIYREVLRQPRGQM